MVGGGGFEMANPAGMRVRMKDRGKPARMSGAKASGLNPAGGLARWRRHRMSRSSPGVVREAPATPCVVVGVDMVASIAAVVAIAVAVPRLLLGSSERIGWMGGGAACVSAQAKK